MLLVSPTDAESLAFASAFATLSIAVRGPDDSVPGETFTVPVAADGTAVLKYRVRVTF